MPLEFVDQRLAVFAQLTARLERRVDGLEDMMRLLVAEAERRGVPLQAAVEEWLPTDKGENG